MTGETTNALLLALFGGAHLVLLVRVSRQLGTVCQGLQELRHRVGRLETWQDGQRGEGRA